MGWESCVDVVFLCRRVAAFSGGHHRRERRRRRRRRTARDSGQKRDRGHGHADGQEEAQADEQRSCDGEVSCHVDLLTQPWVAELGDVVGAVDSGRQFAARPVLAERRVPRALDGILVVHECAEHERRAVQCVQRVGEVGDGFGGIVALVRPVLRRRRCETECHGQHDKDEREKQPDEAGG